MSGNPAFPQGCGLGGQLFPFFTRWMAWWMSQW